MRQNTIGRFKGIFLILLSLCCFFSTAGARNNDLIHVKGKVVDANKEPIIGATIQVKGASSGTVTDFEGLFNLDVDSETTLIISYVGFKTQHIKVNGKTEFSIVLHEDSEMLEEVVVVGYGTLRKSDMTGSVSRVLAENVEEKGYTSIEQMLQGRTSGVMITQNTGALGGGMTFSIRGASSLTGSNQPLVVIDGYPVESGTVLNTDGVDSSYGASGGTNALAALNPNDIESIEILKDASSTAIYGSRGANGVVLVTTKSGKEGKDRIDYTYRLDISQIRHQWDVLRPQEFMAYANEASLDKGDGTIPFGSKNMEKYATLDTYWQDMVFQTGLSHSHQLNISGGDKKMHYALLMGFIDQEGIVRNSRFRRGTIRLNLDRDINYRLKFRLSINGMMSKNDAVMQSTGSSKDAVGGSVIQSALKTSPMYEFTGENFDEMPQNNPLTMVESVKDANKINQVGVNWNVDYKILKDLTAKVRLGANLMTNKRDYYMPRGTYIGDTREGYAYEGNRTNFNYLAEYTLNYNKTIRKKHRINSVLGYTWQWWDSRSMGQAASGFPDDSRGYDDFESASVVDKPENSYQEWAMASFLGRVNYSFDNRYLFTVTARYDGSTRLAAGNKWSLFPSLAVGWNIHKEKFMKPYRNLSELKLRLSYGESGRQSIGVGSSKSLYSTAGRVVINEEILSAYTPKSMANDNLKWERTSQYNLGVDVGLCANRYKLSVETYYKLTRDLLINLPLPLSTGYESYATNAGKVLNTGLEIEALARIFEGRKFSWTTSGNISFNRNELKELDGQLESILGSTFGAVDGSVLHISRPGLPIGSFYGYKFAGIYQTQEEINHSPVESQQVKPGDPKFEDVNKDGKITADDRTIIGNPYPDYIFGWSNELSWKGFTLTTLIQGSIGQDLVNTTRHYLDGLSYGKSTNVSKVAYDNRWTGPGTSNYYPALSSTHDPFFGRFSDFIVEDASYVRLKSVTLSYDVPVKKIKFIRNCRVFFSGTNLLTFTNYSGFDPEVNSAGSNSLTPGVDGGSIPQCRSFSFGINLGF